MDNSIYLFAAFGITWSIIFLYIYGLFRSQKALSHQISKIKKALRKNIDLRVKPIEDL